MQWPPTPGPGPEDVDPGVAVGQLDHLQDVEAEALRDHRQLVGKGDVDVAVGVLGELHELGRARRGAHAGAVDEQPIERRGALGAVAAHAADHPVVVDQLDQHASGQHPFRAVRHLDVGVAEGLPGEAQIGARLGQPFGEGVRGPHRRRRFDDDQVALRQVRRHVRRRRPEVRQVGLVIAGERRRHGDDEGVCGPRRGGGAEPAGGDGAAHQDVETGLDDRHLAPVDQLDGLGIDVDAVDLDAAAGDEGGRRQADVAEADHRDRFKGGLHARSPRRCAGSPCRRRRGCGRGLMAA